MITFISGSIIFVTLTSLLNFKSITKIFNKNDFKTKEIILTLLNYSLDFIIAKRVPSAKERASNASS